jgi:hypothetical protein
LALLASLSWAPRRLAGRLRETTIRIVARLHRAVWLKKFGWLIQIVRFGERRIRSCVRRLPNEEKPHRLKPIRVTARGGIEQSRALLHLVNTRRFAKQSVVL